MGPGQRSRSRRLEADGQGGGPVQVRPAGRAPGGLDFGPPGSPPAAAPANANATPAAGGASGSARTVVVGAAIGGGILFALALVGTAIYFGASRAVKKDAVKKDGLRHRRKRTFHDD